MHGKINGDSVALSLDVQLFRVPFLVSDLACLVCIVQIKIQQDPVTRTSFSFSLVGGAPPLFFMRLDCVFDFTIFSMILIF